MLQLLGIQLSHPEDLEQFDEVLHHNLTSIDDISGKEHLRPLQEKRLAAICES